MQRNASSGQPACVVAHEGPTLTTVGDYTVVDCEGCGFAHVLPLPTAEEAASLYRAGYYENQKPNYFAHQEADRAWWELVYAERYAWFEVWLEDHRRKILDVGSGPGLFLHTGQQRGWEGHGFEPSTVAAAYSRVHYGLRYIFEGPFDDVAAANSTYGYDVVNLSEVLEHLPDPKAALERVASVLSPGGLVCIVVPNDYNLLQLALVNAGRQEAWWVAPPHHLNYFTVPTLYALLRRCGFGVADVSATFPLEMFLLMGQNYVGNDTVGREIHSMRKQLEMNMETLGLGDVKRELYRLMARRGIGRDIVMLGRKA